MPVQYSSGMTQAITTISTGGLIPVSATPVNVNVKAQSTGNTIYTITAGKTFYCTGLIISTLSGSGMVGDIIHNAVAKLTAVCGSASQSVPMTAPPGQYLFSCAQATATVITITHGAGAGNANVFMMGYEV